MAIAQAMVTSFKVDLMYGIHNFGTGVVRATTAADTFKIALYTSAATLNAETTQYIPPTDPNAVQTDTGEVTQTGTGYIAGGNTLVVSVTPTSEGITAYLAFENTTWSAASITARGALIYNATQGNKAVAVLDFGSDKTTTNGNFTVTFPAATATAAVIRLN